MSDEQLYLTATYEFESEFRDKALWAKSMAVCDGDEKKAKYEYIRLKVSHLKKSSGNNSENSESFEEEEYKDVVEIKKNRDVQSDTYTKYSSDTNENLNDKEPKFKGFLLFFAFYYPFSVVLGTLYNFGSTGVASFSLSKIETLEFASKTFLEYLTYHTIFFAFVHIILLILFYKKKYIFPGIFMLVIIVMNISEFFISYNFSVDVERIHNIPRWDTVINFYSSAPVIIILVVQFITILYFYNSKNVERTFIK